ncbi:acyl carrier protein [Nonomuraea thailandensis]
MKELTLDDLRHLMRISAGEDESIDLEGDIIDLGFRDLGYDSLAVLELASRLERDWGWSCPTRSPPRWRRPARCSTTSTSGRR